MRAFPELFPLFEGPGRAQTGADGPVWSDCWSNFAHFGFRTDFLKKFPHDSARFCVEKLKKKNTVLRQKTKEKKHNKHDKKLK